MPALVRLRPGHAPSWNNLAWVEHRLGEPDALPHALRALALRPGEAAFADTAARLTAAAGRWPEAVELAGRAVEMAPQELAYRLSLARILVEAGQKSRAQAELARLDGQDIGTAARAAVAELRARL